MKITAIEIIPIYPRIAARNEQYQVRFRNINQRTVFRVDTDAGVTGYGDYRCPGAAAVYRRATDRSQPVRLHQQ